MSKDLYRAQAVYPKNGEKTPLYPEGKSYTLKPGEGPFEWISGTLSEASTREGGKAWLVTRTGIRRLVWTATMKLVAHGSDQPETKTVRARVLDEAKQITATDRNSSYGEPEDNFKRIAEYWNVWLKGRLDWAEDRPEEQKLGPGDVAAMMIFVKMAREMNAPKEDNKVDGAGYFACWAEVDANKKD